MRRRLRAVLAGILFIAGAAGTAWLLRGQGLDRAEKWVSILGMCVSIVLGVAGLRLGWLTWRQGQASSNRAIPVHASGVGAVGIGGNSDAQVATDISGIATPATPSQSGGTGVTASGTGSVAIGGDSTAPVTTRIVGPENGPTP